MVGADWCYYIPNTRSRILKREHQTFRNSPRPARPANYPTGFDHDVKSTGWEEDEESGVRNKRIEGEEVDLRQLVEGKTLMREETCTMTITECANDGWHSDGRNCEPYSDHSQVSIRCRTSQTDFFGGFTTVARFPTRPVGAMGELVAADAMVKMYPL